MISFENDYSEGAHEKIIERLVKTNREQTVGYGLDPYSEAAKEKIRKACGCPGAEVHFLVGGTQTNAVIIGTMLAPYEGVLSAQTGHINVHEAGAIEYTGHKVISLPQQEGKLSASDIKNYMEQFHADGTREHMVFPGMVYLSHPTEYGTLYTRKELREIAQVCREYDCLLYLDGARLGYGLAGTGTDVTLQEIAQCCDAFYIGGTKVGALFGEAVVFPGGKMPKHFVTMTKQRGAMLAKGRILGIQFDELFTDELYFKIGNHAIEMAQRLKEIFQKKGYSFFLDSPTNQQFVILENKKKKELEQKVRFSEWEPLDLDHTVVRFATSWATTPEMLEELDALL